MTNFDLKTLNLSDGTHKITVIAKASGYKDSEPSNTVSYVVGSGETTYTIPAGTYVFNEELDFTNISADINESFTFTPVNGYKSNLIGITVNPVPIIIYYEGVSDGYIVYNTGWLDENYRTITVATDQTVSKEFYNWFTANATKQEETYTIKAGTYVFNEELTTDYGGQWFSLNFVSNGNSYIAISDKFSETGVTHNLSLKYFTTEDYISVYYPLEGGNGWKNEVYRTITIENNQSVGANFYEWFMTNAVKQKETLLAGLYDANNTLIASWDSLVNDYGMNCQIYYTGNNYSTETTSPYYVLTNYSELANGVTLVIRNDVTSIGYMAFRNCSKLTSITIPDSVTYIGDYAFMGCNSLTSIIVNENNPNYKSIDGNLYSKDGKTLIQYTIGKTATSFTTPDSVTSIGDYAFRYCSSLTSIIISNSVTSIGRQAFEECYPLENVSLGRNLTKISYKAFSGCVKLTTIRIPYNTVEISNDAFLLFHSDGAIKIYCDVNRKPSLWNEYWNRADTEHKDVLGFTHPEKYHSVVWGDKVLLMNFSINDYGEFEAQDGMSWREFIESDYNSQDLYLSDGLVFYGNNQPVSYSSIQEAADNIIMRNRKYNKTNHSGGGSN